MSEMLIYAGLKRHSIHMQSHGTFHAHANVCPAQLSVGARCYWQAQPVQVGMQTGSSTDACCNGRIGTMVQQQLLA